MTARCILITGAASGIGAGIAAELARAGHHLVITDVNRDAAERVAAHIRDGLRRGQREVGDDHVVARGRELGGDAGADAAPGAGDEDAA